MSTDFQQTHKQIVDRYNGKRAIFEAMKKGRRVSLLDSREFEIAEMHTAICQIRNDIREKELPWEMKDQWISPRGKKVKEYWLVARS